MGYRDYLPKMQSGDIFDATNPYWNKAYQYVPRSYMGIDVDSRIALLANTPKTPEVPDLSKFREKLDKDLLYGEKDIMLGRFNELERKIKDELQKNPYALENNPTIISYFNELSNMYNSPELQSQIDKKKLVVAQETKAREQGQVGSFVYDSQTNQYMPITMGQLTNSFLNSQTKQDKLAAFIFGDKTNSGYRNVNFANVGKGTEQDFTNEMIKIFNKVESDSEKRGGSGETINYINGFGNAVSAEEAEGYVSQIQGSSNFLKTNEINLKNLAKFIYERNGDLTGIIGEKAQEGYNQLVVKKLNEADAYTQFGNVMSMQKAISQEAKSKNSKIKNTTYDDIKKYADIISSDETLLNTLKSVSPQELIYDLSVLNSNKNDDVKRLTIAKNPALLYLFSNDKLENKEEKIEAIEKLLELTKRTTQDAVISGNTDFNYLINRTKSTESEYFYRVNLHGGGYGGARKKREEEELSSDFQNAVQGVMAEDKAEEKEISIDEYAAMLKLTAEHKNKSDEERRQIAINEAAANDYVANAIDKEIAELAARVLLKNNENDKERLKAIIEERNKNRPDTSKLSIKDVLIDAANEINKGANEFRKDPKKAQGAVKVKRENVNKTTKVDSEIGKLNASESNDKFINSKDIKSTELIINGVVVPDEAREYILAQNGSGGAIVTQINSLYFDEKQNISAVNRVFAISKDIENSKNKKVKEFFEKIKEKGLTNIAGAETYKSLSGGKTETGGTKSVTEEYYVVSGISNVAKDAKVFGGNQRVKQGDLSENRVDQENILGYHVEDPLNVRDNNYSSYEQKKKMIEELPQRK